ncbi:hypothetical protein ACJJIW_15340 [Microbulbifer sp. JMSA004]|uniref:hypothetical protein n=1 Tax=Microbulbifer sp. JMSA004 TaxID=3243370 RepID=UPI0040394C0E
MRVAILVVLLLVSVVYLSRPEKASELLAEYCEDSHPDKSLAYCRQQITTPKIRCDVLKGTLEKDGTCVRWGPPKGSRRGLDNDINL